MIRRLALPVLAVALAVPQVALAADLPCLTPAEVTALSTYALPGAIASAGKTCAPALPTTAWLPAHGAELAARYDPGKQRAWPAAKAAFLKMSQATSPEAAVLFATMPDDSLRPMADAALSGIIASKVKPDACPSIDRVFALLSPLPAENTAELIALAVGLGSKAGEARLGRFSICKAS
jgi:hypothetical protein